MSCCQPVGGCSSVWLNITAKIKHVVTIQWAHMSYQDVHCLRNDTLNAYWQGSIVISVDTDQTWYGPLLMARHTQCSVGKHFANVWRHLNRGSILKGSESLNKAGHDENTSFMHLALTSVEQGCMGEGGGDLKINHFSFMMCNHWSLFQIEARLIWK